MSTIAWSLALSLLAADPPPLGSSDRPAPFRVRVNLLEETAADKFKDYSTAKPIQVRVRLYRPADLGGTPYFQEDIDSNLGLDAQSGESVKVAKSGEREWLIGASVPCPPWISTEAACGTCSRCRCS